MPREHRVRLILAFAALYVIWGSTYLGIRIAIETIPPFFMAGFRFLVAGMMLYAWARLRGAPPPTRAEWRTGVIIGGLLLLGGNGGVVWAEQRVASGLAALMIGAEPLWVVMLDWLRPGGKRPSLTVALGLAIGFAGVALLVSPSEFGGAGGVDPVGAFALTVATVSWAVGSIYSRHAPTQASPFMSTGTNMLAGSALLFVAGFVTGEPARLDLSAVSARSALAVFYLIVFGAVIGFTAYLWLLKNTTLAKASTYAYVNPVVAVVLGWLILDEPLTARTLLAAAIIIAGVVTISTFQYAKAGAQRLFARGGATALPSSVPSLPEEG